MAARTGERPSHARAAMRCVARAVALVVAASSVAVASVGSPAAAAGSTFDVGVVRFEPIDGPPLAVGGASYRGTLRVDRAGTVNEVDVEDYVRGISEVPTSWPPAAQQAQAVAARTYALNRGEASKDPGRDICATESCQVYRGVVAEQRPGAEAWLAAVEATRGQVLLWKGRPLLAMYSSSNGGQIRSGSQPYLRAGADPDDAASPYHRWRASVAVADLARLLGVAGTVGTVTRQGNQVVVQATVSGRGGAPSGAGMAGASTTSTSEPGSQPAQLGPDDPTATSTTTLPTETTTTASTTTTATPDRGSTSEVRVDVGSFRSLLNGALAPSPGLARAVPSTDFSISRQADQVVLEGRGFGHGIGMGQYGALGKARRGLKAADILAAYYGGVRPTPAPADLTNARLQVALDGAANTVVEAAGRMRVVADDGRVVAPVASGRWTVQRTGTRLRVSPPPGFEAVADTFVTTTLQPAAPRLGDRPSVAVDLVGPAVVRTTVAGPGGGAPAVSDQPLAAGHHEVAFPGSVTAGPWRVDVTVSAGPGWAVTRTLAFDIAADGSPAKVSVASLVARDIAGDLADPVGHQRADLAAGLAVTTATTLMAGLVAMIALMPSHRRRELMAGLPVRLPSRWPWQRTGGGSDPTR